MKVQPERKTEDVTAASPVGFWLLSLVVLFCPLHPVFVAHLFQQTFAHLMFPREEVWFVFVEQDTMYLCLYS